ncbi:MAG TPA: hypothetical protein VM940_16255 [Chthoniobacterales bacterium]|jgi:hypothetical protein|nr:hypothetical protein [Chthoniobacterales bacterium]
MRCALLAVAGLFVLQSSGFSQTSGPLFAGTLLDEPSVLSPWSSLESRDRFFFSTAFGSMRATPEYLPVFDPSEPLSTSAWSPSDNKSSVDRIVDLRAPDKIRFGGEMGFLYGTSSGRFGRQDVAGYIIGTVGNDKFSITAGYYRQESTFNNPRFRR